jgi:hypothetical protein
METNPPLIKFLILSLVLIMLNACGDTGGGDAGGNSSVTLSWTPPTEYEDNTPLPVSDISSYRIYYGTDPSALGHHLEIDANTYMSSFILNYKANAIENNTTYYAAMTTVTNSGAESAFSEVVSFYSN